MSKYENLKKAIEKASAFGHERASNGVNLYGHVPHIAPLAWFHALHQGLDEAEISMLEQGVRMKLPSDYVLLLKEFNGLKLFSNALSIYGLRRNYERSIDASRQPFDLVVPNTVERPNGASPRHLFIGGYSQDGSLVAADIDSQRVYRLASGARTVVLNEWSSLENMLVSEATRLSSLFDEKGRLRDPSSLTTPLSDRG